MRAVIGVIGESVISNPAHAALAEEVGRLVAAAGCALICGGLGGVMEAAARGAREAGGLTIGILPGSERADANPYVEVAIATGLGQIRNLILVLSSDALIAIGGGYGTLSEIGHALRAGKPVIGLRTWEASRGSERAPVQQAATPEEAVRAALRAAAR